MKRQFAIIFALCVFCATSAIARADAPGRLIPELSANAAGLTRAWFAQTTLERGTETVTSASLQDGTLFVTTSGGRVQAFDGESGVLLWSIEAGKGHLFPPAVNSRVVVVVCGTQLALYDRANGKKLQETRIYGNPSAPPVVNERGVYVPCFSERILHYRLSRVEQKSKKVSETIASMTDKTQDQGKASEFWAKKFEDYQASLENPVYLIEPITDYIPENVDPVDVYRPDPCPSLGVPNSAPVIATQTCDFSYIGWVTDKGWFVVGRTERLSRDDPFQLNFKFQVRPNFSYVGNSRIGNKAVIPRDDVEKTPFYLPVDQSLQSQSLEEADKGKGGMFVVGCETGVYAMNATSGELRWTYLTRESVSSRVAAFGDKAFIPTDSGDLCAVTLVDGRELWICPRIKKIVSYSNSRLYVVDELDRLVSINPQNGAREKVLNLGPVSCIYRTEEGELPLSISIKVEFGQIRIIF